MTSKKIPVSVLIMTENEEKSIPFTLKSVIDDFDQVIVVDSFSTDSTFEILSAFKKVEIYKNKFLSWADQRNWILTNCKINNEIVFFLDADEYVDDMFKNELLKIINENLNFSSILLSPKYIFLNCHLRFAYGHPKIRRIFRRSAVSFVGAGAREYAISEGATIEMKSPYIHHDRKPIASWINKHNNNSDREVLAYIANENENHYTTNVLSRRLKFKLWVRKNIWNKMPLLIRPLFYFIYRYIFQLGILDGRSGLVYCYLHAFWYQSLIDIKIIEKKD